MTEAFKRASRLSDSAAIRAVSLPRSLRGFDEAATRRLLNEVASVVEWLTAERESLRRQVESLQAAISAEPGPTSSDADESPEALGNAILAAKHAGEELIAAAHEEADGILAAAATEADRLTEQARATRAEIEQELAEERARLERERADHERTVSDWAAEIEAERESMIAQVRSESEAAHAAGEEKLAELERRQEEIRRFISEQRGLFVSTLESALAQLESLHADDEETDGEDVDLPDMLPLRVGSGDE